MSSIIKITWNNANFSWNKAKGNTAYKSHTGHLLYTWNEVFLIDKAAGEVKGRPVHDVLHFDYWEEDKKKRLITLICKVQGKKITQTKEIQDFKITVKDIKLAYKAIKGVELTTENISF